MTSQNRMKDDCSAVKIRREAEPILDQIDNGLRFRPVGRAPQRAAIAGVRVEELEPRIAEQGADVVDLTTSVHEHPRPPVTPVDVGEAGIGGQLQGGRRITGAAIEIGRD
jgi:hypothetical protein